MVSVRKDDLLTSFAYNSNFETPSSSAEGGGADCYKALSSSNMGSIQSANTIPFANIANSYLVSSISSNYQSYDDCKTQNVGSPSNPNDPEPQPYDPNEDSSMTKPND